MPIQEIIKRLAKNLYVFYRYDCCWPYAVSFYLVLFVYWREAVVVRDPSKWASILSYAILLFYYLYLQKKNKTGMLKEKRNVSFFMSFLTFQIIVWGLLLFRIALL